MSFLSNVSDAVNKRICRFLIHRYLGDLLKEKVRLDQLSVNLYQGTGTINGLSIDSKFVNECLEQAKIPIRLVDGYIGEVTVHIPWGKLLEDSCHFEIRGLEITLQPRPDEQQPTAPDIMASMLESVVGSLASSVDLARSFLNEDGEGEDSTDKGVDAEDGVEAFAQMINAVLARMRISFFDSTIRIEHFPSATPSKVSHGVGLEIRINEIDFMDEQLETCKKMGETAEPITTQPHSLYTVPDLNKILYLKGVQLFTDVFSDPQRCPQTLYAQMDTDSLDSAGGILTSMYLRRQQGSMLSSRMRDISPTESESPLSATSSVFQSCLSTVPEPLSEDLGLSGDFESSSPFLSSPSDNSKNSDRDWTFSNPIKFAEFSGEKQLVQFKLRNPETSTENETGSSRRFDLEMFLGSANIFLSPSQLKILERILGAIFSPEDESTKRAKNRRKKTMEKEMKPEDFAQVEQQLQTALNPEDLWKTGLETGNWSGEEKFYSTSRKPKKPSKTGAYNGDNGDEAFTSIIMTDGPSLPGKERIQDLRIENNHSFTKKPSLSPKINERPEITYFKAKMGSVWFVLTHQDPFTNQKSPEEATSLLQDWAQQFFNVASTLPINVHLFNMEASKKNCDHACLRDHLRLLGCPVSLTTTFERTSTSEDVRVSLTAATCELVECLTNDSVCSENRQNIRDKEEKLEKLNLLRFSKPGNEETDVEDTWREEPDLTLTVQSDDINPMKLMVELAPCFTELDLSMVDRLHSLLDADPPFLPNSSHLPHNGRTQQASLFEMPYPGSPQNGMDLRDDLFQPFDSSGPEKIGGVPILSAKMKEGLGLLDDMTLSSIGNPKGGSEDSNLGLELGLRCPSWTIHLQIPVADLRQATDPSGRTPWWVKRVRDESVRLELVNANLRCPQFSSAASKKGEILLTCTQAQGALLETDKQPIPFLLADSQNNDPCSVRVQWDTRNRSLSLDPERGRGSKSEEDSGSWGSCFQLPKTKDGPFSREHVIHENQELTLVGSNEELENFGSSCRAHTELDISLNLPRLNLLLPNKEFYEKLYNRLVNDLAMWEPSAPSSSSPQLATGSSQYYSIHVAGMPDNDRFILCKSAVQHYDSDGESEEDMGGERNGEGPAKKPTAHRICCSLRSDHTRALLRTPIENKPNAEGEISMECKRGDFFLVSGYHGDPNVAFMYVKTGKLWLEHQNESPYFSPDVCGESFGKSPAENDEHLCAEPTPENLRATSVKDDNLAVGMRLELKPDSNSKEILVTVGVRNTTLHFHPMSNTADWWIMQLVEFFNVIDYPIEGYEMPQVLTELHTHVWSSAISYKHREHSVLSPGEDGSWINSEMRIWIENSDISSYIMQEAKILRFRCLFEDSKIYLREVTSRSMTWATNLDEFVVILKTGFFEVEVLVADEMLNQGHEENGPSRPSLEVKVRNDLVKVWTCADAVAALSRIAQYIVKESTEPSISTKSSTTTTLEDSSTTINSGMPQSYNQGTTDNLQQKSELTLSDEEDLKSLVRSAMKEEQSPPINISSVRNEEYSEDSLPPSYSSDEVKFGLEDAMSDMASDKPSITDPLPRTKSGTDEEYCIVDEIPGSGIRAPSGEPRVRLIDGDKIQISDNHFSAPLTRRDPITSLPSGYPQPVMRYLIRDFSILLNLYGGTDFGSHKESKPYSEPSSQTIVGGRRMKKTPVPPRGSDERGGMYRDHGVSVQFLLSKVCCIYELFGANAPVVSRQVATIDDIEVRDRLAVSQINKILYQYSSEKKPRQTQTPMVSVRLLETKPGEAKLKIGLLPIRLNLDQDTLEFIQDFGSEISHSFNAGPGQQKSEPPVLEVPNRGLSRPSSLINSTSSEISGGNVTSPEKPHQPILTDSVLTVGGFLENDESSSPENSELLNFQPLDDPTRVSFFPKSANDSTAFPSVRFQKSPISEFPMSEPVSHSSSSPNPFDAVGADLRKALETSPPSSNAIYFNEFTFAPALTVKLDYHGKRGFDVGGQGRSMEGLLLGLSQLHCTELRMKELYCRQGLLGLERVLLHAQKEWLGDIIKNQLPQVVGSVGPISSLTQVATGIRDLFWLPVEEYKKDGHFVKGIQKGAESFGVSTASATVELTQLLVGFLQGAAEFAFEITAPEYPAPRKTMDPYKALRRPADFRDGLGRAYDEFKVGVAETAEVLQLAMQDEVAKGRWGGRGVLRQATPLFFRPILVSSRATGHILGGLKSQLRPESRKEEQDKWRLAED